MRHSGRGKAGCDTWPCPMTRRSRWTAGLLAGPAARRRSCSARLPGAAPARPRISPRSSASSASIGAARIALGGLLLLAFALRTAPRRRAVRRLLTGDAAISFGSRGGGRRRGRVPGVLLHRRANDRRGNWHGRGDRQRARLHRRAQQAGRRPATRRAVDGSHRRRGGRLRRARHRRARPAAPARAASAWHWRPGCVTRSTRSRRRG